MKRSTSSLPLVFGLAACLVWPAAALATNGMYLEGYGAEAAGRGGANIAVADRVLGLQANPAGLGQLIGNHIGFDIQFLVPDMNYSDPFGNDIAAEDQVFPMPSISYARGGSESKWTWGIALVSQGGMGAIFEGYTTPFGTTDRTSSEVRFATLIPSGAYSFTPDISIGFSAILGYSDVEFAFWPNTSVLFPGAGPGGSDVVFPGAELTERAQAFNYAFRLGFMWRASRKWQLGAIYQTKTQGDYEDGTLVLNFDNIPSPGMGPGRVAYDAKVDGFTWPEHFGIGVQFRPAQKWMLALDLKRYQWSDAIDVIEVQGSNPSNPMAPPTALLPFVFRWEDQTVIAFGGEYRVSQDVTVRAGYNHGDSPVPDETLNPLFPAIVEDHLTAGVSVNVQSWTANFALARGFEASQTNPSMDPALNPFGPGATVDHSQWTLSLGFTKTFARRKAAGGN